MKSIHAVLVCLLVLLLVSTTGASAQPVTPASRFAPARFYAAPLPGATTLAQFDPSEGWHGGTLSVVQTPWGDSNALLIAADGEDASAEANVAMDLSSAQLRLTFNTQSADAIDHISVVFDTSGGAFQRTFRTDLTEINVSPGNYVVNNGWNAIAKPRRFAYSPSNLTPDQWANVNAVRLIVAPKPGKQASVLFTRLESMPNPPHGIVTFTFDHVPAVVPQRIPPILAAHGYRATAFVTPGWVGKTIDRPWASIDQLKQLQAQGWDIGLHAWNDHPDFTKLQPGQAQFQMIQGAAWLDDNGFSKPMRLWASPEATWNEQVLTMASQYFDACRCANGSGTFPPEDKFLIRAIGVQHNETPDQVVDWVRMTAREHEWLILNFHYFDEGTYDFSYDTDKFAQLVDGVSQVPDIDVMNLSEAIRRLQ
jgi:peptidoglycan/xylan/chitin deacetylase (PgdA/CDA1 family)